MHRGQDQVNIVEVYHCSNPIKTLVICPRSFILLIIWMLNYVTDLLNTQATLERSHLTDSDIIRPHQNTPSITDVLLNLPKDPQVK